MKQSRFTLAATAVVAAFAVYSFYDYRKNSGSVADPKAGEQKIIFDLVKEDIRGIKIVRGENSVMLERRGDEWHMASPVDDLAEAGAVDGFIYQAMVQKGKVFRSKDDGAAVNWAEYGFEPPLGSIEFTGRDRSVKAQISSKNAFDGSYYLRVGDELLLGDRALAQIVDRQASSFRSRRLWRTDHIPIKSVDVSLDYGGQKLKYGFVVDNGKWKMQPEPPFPVDSERVDHWIKRAQNLIPVEIVKEGLEPGELHSYLLVKPSFTLKLNLATDPASEWSVTIGQDRGAGSGKDSDGGEAFLFSSVRPTILRSGVPALRQIRVGPEFFRDGKQPFAFNMELVTELETKQAGQVNVFKKEGASWEVAGADKSRTVNQDALMEFYTALHGLEAAEFTGPSQPSFKPDHRILLRDSKGQTVFELSWGGEFRSKLPRNLGLKMTLAKSSLSKDLIVLPAEKLSALFAQPLINVPPAPQTPSEPKVDHHDH